MEGNEKDVFFRAPNLNATNRSFQILFNYSNIHVNFNPYILLREKTIRINTIATYTLPSTLALTALHFILCHKGTWLTLQQKVI